MADPVHVRGPENGRGRKLVAFGNCFGLQYIYENDEVLRTQVQLGSERSDPEGTVLNKWMNQVDGLKKRADIADRGSGKFVRNGEVSTANW